MFTVLQRIMPRLQVLIPFLPMSSPRMKRMLQFLPPGSGENQSGWKPGLNTLYVSYRRLQSEASEA